MDSTKRVISGTWGEVWVDGYRIAECDGFQAKYSHDSEDVALCGQMASDRKITGTKGTGSMSLYKVYSRFSEYVDAILQGRDTRATVISKLADPDAYGHERIALYNVSFDSMTLADWKAKSVGKVEIPFIFTRHEYLDRIEVQ